MATISDDEASESVSSLTGQMEKLDATTKQFGRSLTRALTSGIAQGKGFEDILRNIGQKFIDLSLRQAFKPLEAGLGSLFSGLTKGLSGAFSGLFGGLGGGTGGGVQAFADGGVINAPSLFPLGRGLGLAGERGAEAIMPLARGPDGRLGVAASGQGGAATTINVSIAATDVESFRRSEAEISAMLARAVARGQRNL